MKIIKIVLINILIFLTLFILAEVLFRLLKLIKNCYTDTDSEYLYDNL